MRVSIRSETIEASMRLNLPLVTPGLFCLSENHFLLHWRLHGVKCRTRNLTQIIPKVVSPVAHNIGLSIPTEAGAQEIPRVCHLCWSFPNLGFEERLHPHIQLPVTKDQRGGNPCQFPVPDYITECFAAADRPLPPLSLGYSLNFRLRPGMGFSHPAGHRVWLDLFISFDPIYLQLISLAPILPNACYMISLSTAKMWFNYFKQWAIK